MNLQDKKIFVIGGEGDIGSAICSGLRDRGASVTSVDLSDSADVVCDLRSTKDILKMCKQIFYLDGLVNCAGVTEQIEDGEYSLDAWKKTFAVNLDAPFLLMRELSKVMPSSGSIVNITSLNAKLAFPNNPAYVASKGGLKQLTKSFALDLGERGIRLNSVGPGYIKTNMTNKSWKDLNRRNYITSKTVLGRWGTPEDLIGVVCFLLSDISSYITGQDIYVDGGWGIKGE